MLTGPKKTILRARKQRQEMSLPEILLWQVLRGSPEGIRFRRLQPSGQLVSDFFCHTAGLVIELDGDTHSRGDQPEFDAKRDAWLQSNGLVVERIAAKDVLRDLDAVYRFILARAQDLKAGRDAAPRLIPPLQGEVAPELVEGDGGVSLPPIEARTLASLPDIVIPLRPLSGATSPSRGGFALEQ
jgi:very-short-patch-repair endonuclease